MGAHKSTPASFDCWLPWAQPGPKIGQTCRPRRKPASTWSRTRQWGSAVPKAWIQRIVKTLHDAFKKRCPVAIPQARNGAWLGWRGRWGGERVAVRGARRSIMPEAEWRHETISFSVRSDTSLMRARICRECFSNGEVLPAPRPASFRVCLRSSQPKDPPLPAAAAAHPAPASKSSPISR
jgi:hypothetical protein